MWRTLLAEPFKSFDLGYMMGSMVVRIVFMLMLDSSRPTAPVSVPRPRLLYFTADASVTAGNVRAGARVSVTASLPHLP
jgi:hypothetical protein